MDEGGMAQHEMQVEDRARNLKRASLKVIERL
jgi:hypothetical protein